AAVEVATKVLAAPATRRLARELGVDLRAISGTGPAGRVTSDDVRRAVEQPAAEAVEIEMPGDETAPERKAPERPKTAAPAMAGAADERIPIRGLRKRIWENMAVSAFTAAHFTFVEECDVTELIKTRDRFNARLKDGEEKLTFLPFIVKAVISALKKFPDLNAHVDDDNMEYIRRAEYNIGVAAASERGLIVPVVRNADRRSILGLAQEIKRLGDSVRKGSVAQADLGGSTFTITSLGKDGGIFATPIINYPEVAIMGVHKISKKPMVKDDQIVIRDMMNLSLSFDHRLIDGHVGAAFTYVVIRLLEDPERLMMEMA
ncbi:2-oxo acid dehydrogenase subunit E2, partial [Myxococcota bacterium]|nr:2-oxo acid dehydrogenase subunit E2 [Myxococcota bacterium]